MRTHLMVLDNHPYFNLSYIYIKIILVREIKTLLRYRQKKILIAIITMYDTLSICYMISILTKHKYDNLK